MIKITEISHVKDTNLTYVLMEAYRDGEDISWIINDFLMEIQPTEGRVITNAQGEWLTSEGLWVDPATLYKPGLWQTDKGQWIDPRTAPKNTTWAKLIVWQYEQVDADIKAMILSNIARYLKDAELNKWSGNHTGDSTKPFYVDNKPIAQKDSIIVRDTIDSKGILSKPEVIALKDIMIDVKSKP